jgi:hypothetical protein
MRINNEDLQPSGASDMASSFNLKPVWLGHIANYSIQLVFTGSPNGTFKLQVSNDPGHPNAQNKAEQYADVVNWTDVSGSAQPVSAAGDHTWQVENSGYAWVRVVWTFSSGSGSLTSARANVKGI